MSVQILITPNELNLYSNSLNVNNVIVNDTINFNGSVITNLPLEKLSDVTITSPTDGQYLSYDAGIWINASGIGSSDTASNIGSGQGDVFASKVGTDFQFKSLDQAGLVTITQTATDVTITGNHDSLNNLTNVAITSPSNNQVLTYNGTDWINQSGGGGSGPWTASGTNSAVGGVSSTADGTCDVTYGTTTDSDSTTSFCVNFGTDNAVNTSANKCFVMGNDCVMQNGSNSFVFGSDAQGSASFQMVFGNAAVANHDGAWVIADSQSGAETDSTTDQFIATFGSGFNFYCRNSGTPFLATNIDINGNMINNKGTANTAIQYIIPTTGFSVTISAGIALLIIEPNSSLSNGNVTMYGSPVNGQQIRISTSQAISTFNLGGGGNTISNPPTTLTAGQVIFYTFNAAISRWNYG